MHCELNGVLGEGRWGLHVSLLGETQEVEKIEKPIMSIFMVNKHVVKTLMSLGVLPQQIIKGVSIFMWNILLATPEKCKTIINQDLITKELIPNSMAKSSMSPLTSRELQHYVDSVRLCLHSQLFGSWWTDITCHCNRSETDMLEVWTETGQKKRPLVLSQNPP